MVISQSFNGAGDTRTPTLLNFIFFWIVQIPLAYLVAVEFGVGSDGVLWSVALSESFLAITGILVFRRGNWKKVKV
jgi:Na+-driven multidrug efflux pump